MDKIKRKRCHWCGKFLSKEGGWSNKWKAPDTFYCHDCYKKGVEIEEEAMGLKEQCAEINNESLNLNLNPNPKR